jgi:hypothetical protein
MRNKGLAGIATLVACGLSAGVATAQPQELVEFVLRPQSIIQLSVSGSSKDSSTTVSDEKTENHDEEASALAGLVVPPVAVGGIAQRSLNEEVTAELEVSRKQRTDSALTAIHFGQFALLAGSTETDFESRVETSAAFLDFDLRTDADYQLGIVVGISRLTLAYLRGRGKIVLELEATGISRVKEEYPLDSTDFVVDLYLGDEEGPFLAVTYIDNETLKDDGEEVDFGGSETTVWGSRLGWRNRKGFLFEVNGSLFQREFTFTDFLVVLQEGLSYGIRIGFDEHLELFANRKTYDTTQDVQFAGYEAVTESSLIQVGLQYRFN